MSEPRKATDVLLEIESKLDKLLSIATAQDLTTKILSNKLNEIMKGLDEPATSPVQQYKVEAVQKAPAPPAPHMAIQASTVDPSRTVMVTAESKLSVEDVPNGFRRTSRPESYHDDKTFQNRGEFAPPPPPPVAPPSNTPVNRPPPGRSIGDSVATATPPPKNKATPPPQAPTGTESHGIVPVEQRVVDRNGKSVFLADVEITDTSTGEQISKSRTNGTGKWMAALPLGIYKVTVRKLESLTREKIESVQTIKVDGMESPLKLPVVLIK